VTDWVPAEVGVQLHDAFPEALSDGVQACGLPFTKKATRPVGTVAPPATVAFRLSPTPTWVVALWAPAVRVVDPPPRTVSEAVPVEAASEALPEYAPLRAIVRPVPPETVGVKLQLAVAVDAPEPVRADDPPHRVSASVVSLKLTVPVGTPVWVVSVTVAVTVTGDP
jgi:hypothetical protein